MYIGSRNLRLHHLGCALRVLFFAFADHCSFLMLKSIYATTSPSVSTVVRHFPWESSHGHLAGVALLSCARPGPGVFSAHYLLVRVLLLLAEAVYDRTQVTMYTIILISLNKFEVMCKFPCLKPGRLSPGIASLVLFIKSRHMNEVNVGTFGKVCLITANIDHRN